MRSVEVFVEYSLIDILRSQVSLVDVVNDLLCGIDDLCASGVRDCDVQKVTGVLARLIF